MTQNNCDQLNEKLSGYIDLELTQQEMQLLSLHLEECSSCQSAYDQLIDLKQKMGEVKLPHLEEEEIMSVLTENTSQTLQTLGWLTLCIGLIGLIILHWIQFWQDDTIPTTVKVLLSLAEAGGALLFLGVLKQRLISRKTDRYKDVQL